MYHTILHREAAGSVQVKFPSNSLYDSSTTSHSTPITVDHIVPSTRAGCVLHKRYLSHNFGPFLQLLDYRTMKIQYRKAKQITMILLSLKIDRFSLLSWIIGRLMDVQHAIDIIMYLLNGLKLYTRIAEDEPPSLLESLWMALKNWSPRECNNEPIVLKFCRATESVNTYKNLQTCVGYLA